MVKDYSVALSGEDDSDIANGNLVYTVTKGADVTGFTVVVKVNDVDVTSTAVNVVGDVITIDSLVSNDEVEITVTCDDDASETDTATYTVA